MRADARGRAGEAEQGQETLDAHFVPWHERLRERAHERMRERAHEHLPALARPAGPERTAVGGGSGRMRNTSPWRLRQAFDFNYWWLAHAVEVRVDAFERAAGSGGTDIHTRTGTGTDTRTGPRTGPHTSTRDRRLAQARAVYARILKRNRGLFNDYFDDMGWLCLAALRLADATGEHRYLADAEALWEHIATHGWNATHGPSVSWRVQQPDYKNAPSNGAFALASLRLYARTGERRFLETGEQTLDWMRTHLVDDRALVLDGIGRTGGGELDRDWIFSYNQGLFIGALTEQFDRTGDTLLLNEAVRTAEASIRLLAPAGVISGENARLDERGGGDAGLFKGIFFRHLETLLERRTDALPGQIDDDLTRFFITATDRLRQHLHPTAPAAQTARSDAHPPALSSRRAGSRPPRSGDDWSRPAPRTTALATELSAVMTLEARARWEAHTIRPAPGATA